MKNCEICGNQLQKEDRTVCYGCKCTQKLAKNGGNTCSTRRERAVKHMVKFPNVLRELFRYP